MSIDDSKCLTLTFISRNDVFLVVCLTHHEFNQKSLTLIEFLVLKGLKELLLSHFELKTMSLSKSGGLNLYFIIAMFIIEAQAQFVLGLGISPSYL